MVIQIVLIFLGWADQKVYYGVRSNSLSGCSANVNGLESVNISYSGNKRYKLKFKLCISN